MNGLMPGLMAGKRGLIMGVANDRSLAWGIARSLAAHGAELAFSFQGEALEKRVKACRERRSQQPVSKRSLSQDIRRGSDQQCQHQQHDLGGLGR